MCVRGAMASPGGSTIPAGVRLMITGFEAGLTFRDYSEPLMEGRL